MRWLDLFSGIGMYAKGLEEAGHEVIGFCEVDAWCRERLKKHWPTKPISWEIVSLNKVLKELLPGFRAKIYHWQTSTAPDFPGNAADCFGNLLTPFAWYDHAFCCWRTWQLCSQNEAGKQWEIYSENWPPSGVVSNGIAYRRQALAHPTSAPEHTFLPTMGANEGKGSSRNRYKGSPNFRGAKMSEALRTCPEDQQYTHPNFAEAVFGLPKDYTE